MKAPNLKSLLIATSMAASIAACKTADIQDTHSKQLVENLLSQDKQKEILKGLEAKAIYDQKTAVSYIFEDMPTDKDTLYVAQKNNIFYAKKGILNVYIPDWKWAKILEDQWYSAKKVSEDVYQINIENNLQDVKNTLENQSLVVVYNYIAYNLSTWTDPETNTATGWYWQAHLSNADWIAAWYQDVRTQSKDTIDYALKSMHMQSTIANPTIVVNIIDSGVDVNNTDLDGQIIEAYDYTTNTPGNNTPGDHASRIAALIDAKANNGYGGVWMLAGYPMRSFDVWTDTWLQINAIYAALDQITVDANANPTQLQVLSTSFATGNDPILHTKLQGIPNNITTAGTWNTASSVVYPAYRDDILSTGAVNAESPTRDLRPQSNTGPQIDFVLDGENVWSMGADGSYSLANGTSFASPILASEVALLRAQDPTADFNTIYNRLKNGAKDLGAPGFDNMYWHGYPWAATALKKAALEDIPTEIDAQNNGNYSINVTPKFYNNWLFTINRKAYYPNGTLITPTPGLDPNNTFSYNVMINTNKWWSATNTAQNVIIYEFESSILGPSYKVRIKSKPITISNLATLSVEDNNLLDGHYYPNPVQDKLTITNVDQLWLNGAKITVSDVTWRTLFMTGTPTLTTDGEGNATIDTSTLPTGMYIVNIEGASPIKIIKK